MILRRRGYRDTTMLGDARRFRRVFLYVIACGEFVKVGIAAKPDLRLKGIEGHNPYPVRLAARRRVPAITASVAEAEAHAALMDAHHRNEWFRCAPERAIEAIHRATVRASAIAEKIRRAERDAALRQIVTMADSDTQSILGVG